MKRFIRDRTNRFIAYLLSLLGVGTVSTFTGCMYGTPAVEYGVPTATYKVEGFVTNNREQAIPNIRVTMETEGYSVDTFYTQTDGGYAVSYQLFPGEQEATLHFRDIDGADNGAYAARDTTVSFEGIEPTGGDGDWNVGDYLYNLDIELNEEEK